MFWTRRQGQLKLVSVNTPFPWHQLLIRRRILKYVKGAIGETDVPDALPEFISQRRRWLNGSFFAATYAIAHVGQIMRSGHSFGRKVTLMLETVYNIINLIFSWFSIVGVVLSSDQGLERWQYFLRAIFICFLSASLLFWIGRLVYWRWTGRIDVLARRSFV